MYYEVSEDFLAHYGVVGMKWGIRRARETQAIRSNKKKYRTDKSLGSRKERKAAYKRDLNKARTDAANRLYSRNSKEMNKRIATQGMGKTLAKSALLGSYGAMKYEKARAEGNSRGKAAVKGLLKEAGNRAVGGVAGMHEYAMNRGTRQGGTGKNGKINRSLDKATQKYANAGSKAETIGNAAANQAASKAKETYKKKKKQLLS